MRENKHYYLIWLNSLTTVTSSCIHFPANDMISLLHTISHISFTNLSVDESLWRFPSLAIVNHSALTWMCKYLCGMLT